MSYNLLKGKRGIIFGALDENSIAWKTAVRVHEEGGTFVLTNAPVSIRMGQIDELAKITGSEIIRVFPDYNDMADNKAYLESVARSFGYFFGRDKKVRVNTISQSPTPTTAGSGVKGFDGFIAYAEKMSPLGNASAMDCANYTITLFSDLTKRVTLQNLYNDGGFSNMGVSDSVMETFIDNQ